MNSTSEEQRRTSEGWRAFLTGEDTTFHRVRRVFSILPASPRCKLCQSPFAGLGGFVLQFVGKRPSRMNPNICGMCEHYAQTHPGGAEVPLSLLFADIRGSSALAERLGTTQFAALIARFYRTVTDELVKADALIDRLIGDEVIALFVPGIAGPEHAGAAVRAAEAILKASGHAENEGPWVPLGAGVHTGNAFVGAVGKAGMTDITALGDDVNLTARLAAQASAGEILITEAARASAGLSTDRLEPRRLDLKGRSAPVDVWVMHIGVSAPSDSAENKEVPT